VIDEVRPEQLVAGPRREDLGVGKLLGVVRERKGADHTAAALKSIRAARPGGYQLFVIMDNLSANKNPGDPPLGAPGHVELCFTLTNASWANPDRGALRSLRTLSWATRTIRTTPR
jgi:hypothetical protein